MGVRVLRGDELQAVPAVGHLVRFVGVDGKGRLVAAEGPVAGPVVDDFLLRRVQKAASRTGRRGGQGVPVCRRSYGPGGRRGAPRR